MKVQNSSNPKRKFNPATQKQEKQQPKEKVYGNLDKEQKYAIHDGQKLKDLGMYVLLHFETMKEFDPSNPQKTIDTGIEDTRTHRISSYTPTMYHEMIREDEKEQKVNMLHLFGGKYIVLNDPSLDAVEDADDLAGMTKAELIELLNTLPATEEEKSTAAVPATKKGDIISLIEKYQNQ